MVNTSKQTYFRKQREMSHDVDRCIGIDPYMVQALLVQRYSRDHTAHYRRRARCSCSTTVYTAFVSHFPLRHGPLLVHIHARRRCHDVQLLDKTCSRMHLPPTRRIRVRCHRASRLRAADGTLQMRPRHDQRKRNCSSSFMRWPILAMPMQSLSCCSLSILQSLQSTQPSYSNASP